VSNGRNKRRAIGPTESNAEKVRSGRVQKSEIRVKIESWPSYDFEKEHKKKAFRKEKSLQSQHQQFYFFFY